MDSLLSQTSVLIRELQNDLLSYENSQDRTNDAACSDVVANKIQRLLEICDRLDIFVNKEPAQRRAQSRQRVNEIKYDIRHYKVCKQYERTTIEFVCLEDKIISKFFFELECV